MKQTFEIDISSTVFYKQNAFMTSTRSLPIASSLKKVRRMSPRWLIGIGLLGCLLIAVPIVRQRLAPANETTASNSENPLPVETTVAEQARSYEVSRTYTGEIASVQASELGFERSGQLVELLVPEGAQVQADAALARLDVRNLQTQRLQIEAEKARANAQLMELEAGARSEDIAAASAAVRDLEQQIELQRTQRSRREYLYERGAIAKETLDEYRFNEGALQARLDQSRSQLEELQNGTRPEQISAQAALIQQLDARLADLDVNLAKSTIRAPFSGTVSEHKVDTGTVVNAGQAVLRLVENTTAEARIGIPASAVDKLNIGGERTVTVDGANYTATVVSILPEVDSQTRTQTVVLELEPRATERVNPGQTVRLNLSDRIASKGFWLPTEALTQGIRGLWTCYVLEEDERTSEEGREMAYVVQPQSVEVIHQEGDRAFVTGTLQPNDEVVSSGAHRLVPGQRVTLASQQAQNSTNP